MAAAKAHLATWSDRGFVEALAALSGDGDSRGIPSVGDTIEYGEDYNDRTTATVIAVVVGSSSSGSGDDVEKKEDDEEDEEEEEGEEGDEEEEEEGLDGEEEEGGGGGGGYIVRNTETGEVTRLREEELDDLDVVESVKINALWEAHQQRTEPIPDGVAYADGIVPPALVATLHADVDRLIAVEPEDYHPGSGTRVRDLVHPSLYPYVDGRSVRNPAAPAGSESGKAPPPELDRFGRDYEGSRYQWLPTPFHIDADGGVAIPTYINNLSRERHPEAYTHLAALFAVALPLIESVVGYVDTTTFNIEKDDQRRDHALEAAASAREVPGTAVPSTSLRGRDLLVIPKIVEYQLQPGETHEGVWHVEGMSHEQIVATCVYILSRDAALEGGDLCFKRAYTMAEASRLYWHVPQDRPTAFYDMVGEGTVPIGRLPTPAGRLLVFPNSHIHMLSKLWINEAAGEAGEGRTAGEAGEGRNAGEAGEGRKAGKAQRRRVIVFWIVDPAVSDMPSTRDVAPQQETAFTREEALAIRLELMEERKRHKENLNVRAVSLCEH